MIDILDRNSNFKKLMKYKPLAPHPMNGPTTGSNPS